MSIKLQKINFTEKINAWNEKYFTAIYDKNYNVYYL